MYQTTFALGSKACAARLAFPAATFPMDIARSMTCELELIGFQSMVCGGGCQKRRSFETAETLLAKPSFGMSVFAAISRSAASSRPMLVRRVVSATDGIDGSEIFLRASASYHSLVCEVLCVQFTFGIGAYWKGRSPISADKLGLPSTDGIDHKTKPT